MSEIGYLPLSQGKVAIVDADLLPHLQQWRWWAYKAATGKWYAKTIGGNVPIGRVIMEPPKHLQVDHINGDPLDNRRANLRACTRAQNAANTRARTGRFKGVYQERGGRWRAVVTIGLGRYDTAEEAGRAYDEAARKILGSYGRYNFPRDGEQCARGDLTPEPVCQDIPGADQSVSSHASHATKHGDERCDLLPPMTGQRLAQPNQENP